MLCTVISWCLIDGAQRFQQQRLNRHVHFEVIDNCLRDGRRIQSLQRRHRERCLCRRRRRRCRRRSAPVLAAQVEGGLPDEMLQFLKLVQLQKDWAAIGEAASCS
jgi:hypothetical protein